MFTWILKTWIPNSFWKGVHWIPKCVHLNLIRQKLFVRQCFVVTKKLVYFHLLKRCKYSKKFSCCQAYSAIMIPGNLEPLRLGNGEISHHKTPFMCRLWNYITLSTMSRTKQFCNIEIGENFMVSEVTRLFTFMRLSDVVIAWFSTKANNTLIVSVYQLIQKQLLYEKYDIKAVQTSFQFANIEYKYLQWYL